MTLLPLQGFAIGITADRRWAEQAELFERRGATVLHGPTIATQYLASDEALRRATELVIAGPPDYVVATTGIGVRAWFEAAQAWGVADRLLDALGSSRVVTRGPKATAAAQVAGLRVWSSPPSERLDDVVALLEAEGVSGRTVAFQHYGKRDEHAVALLAAAGADVVEVPVYRYRPPADGTRARALVDAVCDRHLDAVTFTSAPAVEHLVVAAGEVGRAGQLLHAFNEHDVVAACIGPVCAEAARAVGIDRPVAPALGRLGLLVRALTDVLQTRRRALCCGGVPVVVQGRAVTVNGVALGLTPGERAVLDVLLRHQGVVVSRTAMVRATGTGSTSAHALEATIARLRRHLGAAGPSIRAVRGRGYCLDADECEGARRP